MRWVGRGVIERCGLRIAASEAVFVCAGGSILQMCVPRPPRVGVNRQGQLGVALLVAALPGAEQGGGGEDGGEGGEGTGDREVDHQGRLCMWVAWQAMRIVVKMSVAAVRWLNSLAYQRGAPWLQAKSKMSKAEKAKTKKEKAKSFNQSAGSGKVAKNAKRWN